MQTLQRIVLIASIALPGLLVGCGGTNEEAGGQAGSGAEAGSGGASGKGGTAGSGTAGSGTAGSGTAGSGTAGSGTAGSGTAGSGTAGSGTAGAAGGGAVCKPGDTQMTSDGCNSCICGDDGQWACTKKACDPQCPGDAPACAAPPQGCHYENAGCIGGQWTCGNLVCDSQCKPGDSQPAPDGCNTCICDDQGQWACTKKGCVSECMGDPPPCVAPPEGCDYVGGGCVNGQWTCGELSCPTQCKMDSDCPAIKMPCQLCPDGSPSCPQSLCLDGTCQIAWSTCGGGGVGPGLSCNPPGAQAPADDGCNTCICGDNGTWGCTKIGCGVECTGPMPPCAAPPPGCDYVGGGCVNGQWTCGQLTCSAQCKMDSDCPVSDGPCQLCPDGSASCPVATCIDGMCVQSIPGCTTDNCAAQDAKGDGLCDAFFGYAWDGSSCTGVSGCSCVGVDCKGLSQTPEECQKLHANCPSTGGVNPGDKCDPPGATAPAADGCNKCVCSDVGTWDCTKISCGVECTGPMPPCAPPPDGCSYVNGGCVNGQWTCGELSCPMQCMMDSDCPAIKMPCQACADGNGFTCPESRCVNGACDIVWTTCGCAAQDIQGSGMCKKLLGYAWDGKSCTSITGCECVGTECKGMYATQADCDKAHAACQ